jgi:hypothetical protein
MSSSLAYANATPGVAAPRGASWLAALRRVATRIGDRNRARRQEAALRRHILEALGDAARVRLMADTVREHNPGFAADLYAAAERTMAAAGR